MRLKVIPINDGSPVPVPTQEGQPVRLPVEPSNNLAQTVLAIIGLLVVVYFGEVVFVTLAVSVLVAFVLAPLVNGMERYRLPRSAGAAIAVALLMGMLYVGSYFLYVRAVEFAREFPKYSGELKTQMSKLTKQARQISKTKDQIMPDSAENQDAVKVKNVDQGNLTSEATATITERLLAATFIPFLAYFMLSWQEHLRAGMVKLFVMEKRTAAYVTISRISTMLRSFIVGNFIIGLFMAALSTIAFWWLGIPYFYFVGFISGFASLIPYLGVVLAVFPPVAAGIGVVNSSGLAMAAVCALVIHLFALNVLYPKILGRRLQINPLAVTIALLIFGFLWGAMGLVLAIPITAAMKIVFEHIEPLQPWAELMGEGD